MDKGLAQVAVRLELLRRHQVMAMVPVMAIAVTLLQASLLAVGPAEDLCILCGCDLGVHVLFPCPWLGCQWLYPLMNINCCAHFGETCWTLVPA